VTGAESVMHHCLVTAYSLLCIVDCNLINFIYCNLLCIVDLSRNDLTEIPYEIYTCWSLETLNCYYNALRALPDKVGWLQNLLGLNLRYIANNY